MLSVRSVGICSGSSPGSAGVWRLLLVYLSKQAEFSSGKKFGHLSALLFL